MEHIYQHIPGYFWFQYAYRYLLDRLPAKRPSRFVEVGVYQGRSLCWLAVEAANSGKPIEIWGVDDFRGLGDGTAIRDACLQNLACLRRSVNGRLHFREAPSQQAAADFADKSLDVVWLDAGHGYDDVRADIEAWWPKLKPKGQIGGDDWEMDDVRRAVTERFPGQFVLLPGWCDDGPAPRFYPSWLVQK